MTEPVQMVPEKPDIIQPEKLNDDIIAEAEKAGFRFKFHIPMLWIILLVVVLVGGLIVLHFCGALAVIVGGFK